MTVYNDENSPKKAATAHGHKWAELRRRDENKTKICAWILVVVLPFLLVKLVFFYASPFLLFSPSSERNQAELTTELEFASPAFFPSMGDEETLAGSKNSSTSEFTSDSGSDSPVQYETESQTPVPVEPPTQLEVDDESEVVKAEVISPQPAELSGVEEPFEQTSMEQEERQEEVEDSPGVTPPEQQRKEPVDDSPKDEEDKEDAEKGEAPPEQVDDSPEVTPTKQQPKEPVDDSPKDNDKEDAEKWEAPPKQVDDAPEVTPTEQQPKEPVDDSSKDNDKEDGEKWEAPPEQEKTADEKHAIEEVTITSNASALAPAESKECDLYDGGWVHDPEGPLYTNQTCFYMQGHQNCLLNGRPDKAYMHWKWKPRHCDLPRFDAKGFMEMFQGKTIGFVGDSLSRNQMQSLLCMLSQLEIPEEVYQSSDDKSVRWLFKTYQVTLATVWSPYLLKETTAELQGIEEGQSKLYTDILDDGWTSVMNDFDVMVLSIGQWYFKSSVYIRNEEIIGCHYCPGRNLTEIGFFYSYREAVRQVLDKVTRDYKGLTIMSTFAIDHFENGSWNQAGSCTREQPFREGEKVLDGKEYDMHQIVIEEYNSIVERRRRNRKRVQLGLLDVTLISLLRADGHPGPWSHYHPFDGVPPGTHVQNDCLHWCLPGPVDTWNQLLVEIVQSNLKK